MNENLKSATLKVIRDMNCQGKLFHNHKAEPTPCDLGSDFWANARLVEPKKDAK